MRSRLLRFTPWQLFIRSALICAMAGGVLFGLSLKRIERLPLSPAPLHFDGNQAFDSMRTLSKRFPNRVTYSDSRREAALWLKQRFRSMGYEPRGMLFSEVVNGKEYTDLEDVFAEKRGTRHPDQIIMVSAHYDVVETTREGAMDDGSGIGIVLELARVFAHEPTDRTILFMATDSEEYGAFWGAHEFARHFDRVNQIVATANFDFVGPEKQTRILTLCDGLKQGYTPLWLRELALDSLRSVSESGKRFQVLDFTNLMEFIERAMEIPAADHGAYLAAGIPAFDWVGETDNFPYEMAHYHHTLADTVEAMQPQSLRDMGRAAERLVRSVDALPRLPDHYKSTNYWKVTRNYYLEGWSATLLQILAFIPFLIYGASRFGFILGKIARDRTLRAIRNEAKNVAILLGSLLLGYVLILLLPALKIITQYEVYPSTQKDLMLYNPNFLAIGLVIGSVGGVYWLFNRTFTESDDALAQTEVRHAFHAAVLLLVVAVAFLKNSYLATMLLLPPAYLWLFLRAKRRTEDRILNTLLILGGSITFVTMAIVMTTVFHVGVVYWYIFLASAYGLISAYSVVCFLVALTIMIRLFRAYVL